MKKHIFNSFIFILFMILLSSTTLFAKTKRTTNVVVQNSTGKTIEAVTVVHKYSDNYKDKHTWGKLKNKQKTKEKMSIRYNTGWLTTGQDWWLVSWKYEGDNHVYYTNPKNFRGVIDEIEGKILNVLSKESKKEGDEAEKIVTAVGDTFFNRESTKGFKKHFLKSEDQAKGVLITITSKSVKFHSRSGNSSTEGIASKKIKGIKHSK